MNKLLLILSCTAALLLAGAPAALAGPGCGCGHYKAKKVEKTAKAHPADCGCRDCKTAEAGCDCGGKAADCTDDKAADCPGKGSHADCPYAKSKSKAKAKAKSE